MSSSLDGVSNTLAVEIVADDFARCKGFGAVFLKGGAGKSSSGTSNTSTFWFCFVIFCDDFILSALPSSTSNWSCATNRVGAVGECSTSTVSARGGSCGLEDAPKNTVLYWEVAGMTLRATLP